MTRPFWTLSRPFPERRAVDHGLGALAAVFYVVHVSWLVLSGSWAGPLWFCHVGALLIAGGLWSDRAGPVAIGLLWLALGTPLWPVGVAMGGEFIPTSMLTHVGGLAIGFVAVARLGWPPRWMWWRALAGGIALHLLTRQVAPADSNVNFAGGRWGEVQLFYTYPLFLLGMSVSAGAWFAGVERLLRRLAPAERRAEAGAVETLPGGVTGPS